MSVYDINGNVVCSPSSGGTSAPLPFMSINHKGYRRNGARDNSMDAFKASFAHGFRAIETDIRYSSDNIPVLCHNETYESLTVSETTYTDLKTAGMASLEELVKYCKATGLIPYLELKLNDNTMNKYAIDIVTKYGMMKNVVWISAYQSAVAYVVSICPYANVRVQGSNSTTPSSLSSLATGKNTVGAYFPTSSAGAGVNSAVTLALAQAGYVVGGFTYSSQRENFVIDSGRGVTEFTTDYTKAEDLIVADYLGS